jgi:hypothetical protein
LAVGVFLTSLVAGSALAEPGTPAQRKACTPDVYLCPGQIPNVRAKTRTTGEAASHIGPAVTRRRPHELAGTSALIP